MTATAVIIGASHAGSQLSLSLRQSGWQGDILLLGDETYLPYHRPPLSKDYLGGELGPNDILLRPAALYDKQGITLKLNHQVLAIDRAKGLIEAVSDRGKQVQFHYDKLALCTGARVRTLNISGANLKGVHYLRTLSDVEHIRTEIQPGSRGVIIGGGYIGLETAAMLRGINCEVSVLEAAPQLLGRVAAPEIGAFYQALHEQHGVNLRTNAQANELLGEDRVQQVVCADRTRLEADFVIIGIGVIPNQELAEQAGLDVNDGIVVNKLAQTSDPNIVAAGDCTRFNHPLYGNIRLESVPNATEQSKVAAATLCGKQTAYASLPWFWSDQYDCKLQIAGINRGYDEILVRGSTAVVAEPITSEQAPTFCVYYFREQQLIAADCINRPKEFMLAKMWLQKSYTPDKTKLVDDGYALTRDD